MKRKIENQYTKLYKHEPLHTYKEMIDLAWKGIFRYVMHEVAEGRTYQDIADELGMTRANINRIVQRAKKEIATVDKHFN